jgi:hypothetical protein
MKQVPNVSLVLPASRPKNRTLLHLKVTAMKVERGRGNSTTKLLCDLLLPNYKRKE